MLTRYADELVTSAVKGMLPKNRLARQMIKKLNVYKEHGQDHAAQQPIVIKVQNK
jgi:large subunit ribosomal protein L13